MNLNLIYSEYSGRGITLQTDEKQMNCQVFCVFSIDEDSEQKYIALLEILDDDVSNHLLIYKFDLTDEGAPILANIESEDEYKSVTDFLNDYMNYLEESEQQETEIESSDCGCNCGSCNSDCK